jgi:large subunit ribosomal protein L15
MLINTVTHESGRLGPKRLRVGRGIGSRGKTSGRGHKGESSRSGAKEYLMKEGGQMPFFRKVAKRGFNSRKLVVARSVAVVDVKKIDFVAERASVIDIDVLKSMGLVSRDATSIRILGAAAVTRTVKVVASHVSRAALESIHGAGGVVILV